MTRLLLTAAVIALGAGSANAALITRTYTNVSTFAAGPVPELTLTFTVTYDPAVPAVTPVTLDAFSSSSALASFAGPNGAETFRSGGNGFLVVGGLASFGVQAVAGNNNDFYTFFQFDTEGNVVSTPANAVSYSQVGFFGTYNSVSSVTTVVPAAAVPEPASWAMMIGGFGLIGGAMRRRTAQVAFA